MKWVGGRQRENFLIGEDDLMHVREIAISWVHVVVCSSNTAVAECTSVKLARICSLSENDDEPVMQGINDKYILCKEGKVHVKTLL